MLLNRVPIYSPKRIEFQLLNHEQITKEDDENEADSASTLSWMGGDSGGGGGDGSSSGFGGIGRLIM